jgi:hypothetical protein
LANWIRIDLLFDRKIVEDAVEQTEHQATKDPISLVLVNAVLALGAHYLNFQGDFNEPGKPLYNALVLFNKAFSIRHQLISGKISIRNLQVRNTKLFRSSRETLNLRWTGFISDGKLTLPGFLAK